MICSVSMVNMHNGGHITTTTTTTTPYPTRWGRLHGSTSAIMFYQVFLSINHGNKISLLYMSLKMKCICIWYIHILFIFMKYMDQWISFFFCFVEKMQVKVHLPCMQGNLGLEWWPVATTTASNTCSTSSLFFSLLRTTHFKSSLGTP